MANDVLSNYQPVFLKIRLGMGDIRAITTLHITMAIMCKNVLIINTLSKKIVYKTLENQKNVIYLVYMIGSMSMAIKY